MSLMKDLSRAAQLLDYEADGLRESYTERATGAWPDTDTAHKRAHRQYLEYRELAERLRGYAQP